MTVSLMDAYNYAAQKNPTLDDQGLHGEVDIGKRAHEAANQLGLDNNEVSEFCLLEEIHDVIHRMSLVVMTPKLKEEVARLMADAQTSNILEALVIAHIVPAMKVGILTGSSYARLVMTELNDSLWGDPPSPSDE